MSHSDSTNTGGGAPTTLRRGVHAPHQCPLDSVARYPMYADVRLHIPMTRRLDRYKVLEKWNPAVLDIPFLNMRELEVAGVQCKLFRISFSGCLGYELHCSVEDCPKLYKVR